jgi:hypothetical protein
MLLSYVLPNICLALTDMEWKIPPEILRYYRQAPESTRLQSGPSRLEFARTKEVITRWLEPSPAVVLDVGGGPGAYATWLADLGHEVHLVDPVAELVGHARSLRGDGPRWIGARPICRSGVRFHCATRHCRGNPRKLHRKTRTVHHGEISPARRTLHGGQGCRVFITFNRRLGRTGMVVPQFRGAMARSAAA